MELHLKGFQAMGAEIINNEIESFVEMSCDRLQGASIYLDFPSVGATENIMMAAVLAEGTTIIENAAEEPEIVDLANFLNKMGARVKGAGTETIKIEGVEKLGGCKHGIIPDRIETGTFMVAAAITRGDLGPHMATDIKTLPYPGFPTDIQSPFMTYLTTVEGSSTVIKTVFENRFMHVVELNRMGAQISTEGRSAVIDGPSKLTGCDVRATDLRAGAAMILAGLVAEGTTRIGDLHHIDRGYENIVAKLKNLGADIERINID